MLKGVDKIYVINLDKATERWSRMKERLFKIHNLPEDYVERFTAINGMDPRIQFFFEDSNDSHLRRNMACSFSHYDVWNLAVSRNQNVLIMEDDVFFRKDWIPQTENAIRESNPDLFMLDGSGFIEPRHGLRRIENQYLLLSGAYYINIPTMKKLISLYSDSVKNKEMAGVQADYRLLEAQKWGNSWFVYPYLAVQEFWESCIDLNKDQTMFKWYEDNYKPWFQNMYDWPQKEKTLK